MRVRGLFDVDYARQPSKRAGGRARGHQHRLRCDTARERGITIVVIVISMQAVARHNCVVIYMHTHMALRRGPYCHAIPFIKRRRAKILLQPCNSSSSVRFLLEAFIVRVVLTCAVQ